MFNKYLNLKNFSWKINLFTLKHVLLNVNDAKYTQKDVLNAQGNQE